MFDSPIHRGVKRLTGKDPMPEERAKAARILALCKDKPVRKILSSSDIPGKKPIKVADHYTTRYYKDLLKMVEDIRSIGHPVDGRMLQDRHPDIPKTTWDSRLERAVEHGLLRVVYSKEARGRRPNILVKKYAA